MWLPPIGIPVPPFGIEQKAGPATHFVEPTSAAATDDGNPNGSRGRPRRTIPPNPPAGSVVELHGGPYAYAYGGVIPMGGMGTAEKPIFIRGGDAKRTKISRPVEVNGQYVILEHVDVDKWSTSNDCGVRLYGVNHVALRDFAVRNGPRATTSAVATGGGSHHILICTGHVHGNGDWQATTDEDHHGIGIGKGSSYVWVLSMNLHHNSGDGLQINGESLDGAHHIYVGTSAAHHNKQCGLWSKKASDVVFSQNEVYGHRPSPSSPGAGMGFQYGPERVRFLHNHIHGCTFGISSGSDGDAPNGESAYAVGNLIHDIHAEPGGEYRPNDMWIDGAAIRMVGCLRRYLVSNTIRDCDAGIMGSYGGEFHIENNIIERLTGERAHHVFIDGAFDRARSTLSNNLFGGERRIGWGSAGEDFAGVGNIVGAFER